DLISAIEKERCNPLKFLDVDKFEFDEELATIISRAVAINPDNRFKSADEFLRCLQGEIRVEPIVLTNTNGKSEEKKKESKRERKGNGFADIAGMNDLKMQIKSDVIELIENPEEYKRHGLSLPNGILLYGPPGCGKTFFAEKFAEEVGFNFYQIKPSDIQSKWVNASQENVKQLFDEAAKQAPSIIFIDEVDALLPNRENNNISHMNTSVVNEFLAQLNNAGERGLFIIGATNLPTSIDPAIMRSGRLEQRYYISPPDFEARRAMFEIYLKKRPVDFGLDYEELSTMTDGFVSADIRYIVDKTSRLVIRERLEIITQETLKRVILDSKPTISKAELLKHQAIRDKFEGIEQKQDKPRRIGY
ncbi:MAG: ATP-binding protein, partial [Rikenellaceae bacterium]